MKEQNVEEQVLLREEKGWITDVGPIRDDPNSKRWDYSDIPDGTKKIKGPAHMVWRWPPS